MIYKTRTTTIMGMKQQYRAMFHDNLSEGSSESAGTCASADGADLLAEVSLQTFLLSNGRNNNSTL